MNKIHFSILTKFRLIVIYCSIILINVPTLVSQSIDKEEHILNTLDEAWNLSLKNNPNYKVYLLNQEKAKNEIKVSKAFKFPTVNGSFNSQKNMDLATTPVPGEFFGQPGQTIDAQFGSKYSYNTGITVSKNLMDLQSFIKLKIAKQGLAITQAQAENFVQELKSLIATYYYQIIITNKAHDLAQKDLQNANNIERLSLKKFEEGIIDQLSYNKAKINTIGIEQNLIKYQNNLQQYYSELKVLLGISHTNKIIIKEEIKTHISINFDFQTNTTVNLSELKLEESKLKIKYQQAAFIPKISISNYFGKQQFRDESGLSFFNGDWSDYSYFSVNLSIPLFHGLSNHHHLKINRIDKKIAQKNLENEIRSADSKDQLLIKQFQLSRSNVDKASEKLELFKQNSELSNHKYLEGVISLDDYLKDFDNYIKSESEFLNALSSQYSYYSTIISREK